MADTILTPPPAAAAAPAQAGAQHAANLGQRFPSSAGEIQVTDKPVTAEPPKPGTEREGMLQRLQSRAKPAFGTADPNAPAKPKKAPTPPPTKPADAKPAAVEQGKPKATEPQPGEANPAGEDTETSPTGDTNPKEAKVEEGQEGEPTDEEISTEAKKPGKVNPWKLVETYKKKAAALERDIAEKAKLIVDEPARKAEVERLTKAEQRAKELEDHIRFKDYEKSQEFTEKYHKPYEEAWERGMGELAGIRVTDAETGTETEFTPQHMLELVNAPLSQARKWAEDNIPAFANDVMAQRKEIRAMFDKRNQALHEAKTKGAEREQAAQQEAHKVQERISKEVSEHWTKLNDAIKNDPKVGKYFQPVEGDDEANSRLAKGYELTDSAFNQNPMDPKLSSEERAAILRKHVAVRNRSAAYGKLIYINNKMELRVAELEAELEQYKESTPKTDGQKITSVPNGDGDERSAMMARIRARAK